jgi:lipoprotein-releasing system permease protein
MMIGSQMDFIRTLIDSAPHIIVLDERRTPAVQPAIGAFPHAVIEIHGLHAIDEIRGLKDWPAMLADIRSTPDVLAAPALSGGVSVRFAGHSEAVSLLGIDPRYESALLQIDKDMVGGALSNLETTQNGIVLSTQVADRLGAHIGDTVIVSSSAGVVQRAKIVALVNSDIRAGAANMAYALLRSAQVLFARPNIVNQIHIKLRDPQTAQAFAAAHETRWGFKWQSWQERSRDFLSMLVLRDVIMYAVISAILLVASFGVYNVISTNVSEKRRDIAIMRAVGFSEWDLSLIFLLEGLAVGVAGALLGFVLGVALMEALAAIPFRFQGQVMHLTLDRSWRQFAIAGGVSTLSAALAAWLPARKAASLDPVEILRGAA